MSHAKVLIREIELHISNTSLCIDGQVYDQGIPFKTSWTLEKCPFHDEINERKIKN